MPKLSIIIPIYNAENSLARCLDSILNQGFRDYELLLVNDGSTDSSLSICWQYSKNDLRIRIIDKPNGGVSSARNCGLKEVQGDWVLFVDSDDFLIQDSLEKIFNELKNVDLAIGSIQYSDNLQIDQLDINDFLYEDKIANVLASKISHPLLSGPWAKLFRREIIEREVIRFDESLFFGEDAVFVKEYLLHINTIQVSDVVLYYYENIGDDVYKKYNKSFDPIWNYYNQINEKYRRLEHKYNIELNTKELIGVVFNIAIECLNKNGLKEWVAIHKFLSDDSVGSMLRERKSRHINILLKLSDFGNAYLFMTYFRLVEWIKMVLKR